MRCPSCGEELLSSSTKCPFCGFVYKSSQRRAGALALSDFTTLGRDITARVGVVESESIRNANDRLAGFMLEKGGVRMAIGIATAVWKKDITPSRNVDYVRWWAKTRRGQGT